MSLFSRRKEADGRRRHEWEPPATHEGEPTDGRAAADQPSPAPSDSEWAPGNGTAAVPVPPSAGRELAVRPGAPGPGGAVARRPDGRPARPRNVIVVERVVKTYSLGEIEVHALQGVSLTIERGDFVAIMGASGSGKSTLMNILGCLDLPTRGRYLLDGVDVRGMEEDELSDVRNRKIGFVFQSFNLIPRTEAIANVELPLVYGGLKKAERRKRAERALAEVGLSDRLHHLSSELSGGQQQRVAVARAIATNPAIILADEPTGNLDTKSTREVLEIFGRLNVEGRTVVLITHEDDVAHHAKRVIRLIDGQIVEDRRQGPVRGAPPLYGTPITAPVTSGAVASASVGGPPS